MELMAGIDGLCPSRATRVPDYSRLRRRGSIPSAKVNEKDDCKSSRFFLMESLDTLDAASKTQTEAQRSGFGLERRSSEMSAR